MFEKEKNVKSVMQKLYSMAPSIQLGRSVFNRSFGHKFTCKASKLIPFFWDEILPGDTMKLKTTVLARLTTPIVPIMDNLHVMTEYFFVPNRLLWENWQRFMGERDPNPDSSIDYTVPTINLSAPVQEGHIGDYLGIPPGVTPNSDFSALPFRAVFRIFNEWYRDQNIDNSIPQNIDDGPDNITDYDTGLTRAKFHDYFTSCLPSPQKGDAVSLGFDTAVIGTGKALGLYNGVNEFGMFVDSVGGDLDGVSDALNATMPATGFSGSQPATSYAVGVSEDPDNSQLLADLSDETVFNINMLRELFQIQRFREKEARSGTRYKEILMGFFGVDNGDARLMRSEYLNGYHNRMKINPVQQTSETSVDSPQGNLAAYGLYAGNGGGFYKSFSEHGIVIGFFSVIGDITYQQGIFRDWWRSTRFDYYWPQFAHLSEQAVLNRELWIEGDATDDDVFGYQERYHEYRYKNSLITGQLRSAFAESLDVWHLSEEFASQPTLSETFINDQTSSILERVLAVTEHGEEDYPQLIVDAYFDYKCERPMPTRGVPGYIDHF